MGRKIHISKKNLLKLALFIAVLATAVLFDLSRDKSDIKLSENHNTKGSSSHELSQFCFYSTFNSFKQKSLSTKFSARKLFLRTQSEFLQKYHNLKAGQSVKSELLQNYVAAGLQIDRIRFQRCLFRNPDDGPLPLS